MTPNIGGAAMRDSGLGASARGVTPNVTRNGGGSRGLSPRKLAVTLAKSQVIVLAPVFQ